MPNAVLGHRMKLTVNLTVKMLPAEKSSLRDDGLHVPLMIEWE